MLQVGSGFSYRRLGRERQSDQGLDRRMSQERSALALPESTSQEVCLTTVENFEIRTRRYCEPGQADSPQNRRREPMAEIAISIRTESDRRSLTASMSIRVPVGSPRAPETQAQQSVERQLGEGPLLPDSNEISHPFDSLIINVNVRSDFA